jgi:hypothetical protein
LPDVPERQRSGRKVQVGLEDDEVAELRALLSEALSELSSEIAGTDNASVVRDLRVRRDLIRSIQDKLGPG